MFGPENNAFTLLAGHLARLSASQALEEEQARAKVPGDEPVEVAYHHGRATSHRASRRASLWQRLLPSLFKMLSIASKRDG